MPRTRIAQSLKLAVLLAAVVIVPGAAIAATAVATRPAIIYAAPNLKAKTLGSIGVSQMVDAKACKKGWCRVGAGYVRSSYLRFIRVRKGYENEYDYNAPLGPPNFGYVPGFWGYGGRRYYDRYGNYTKFGTPGYRGPVDRLDGTVQTVPRRDLLRRR